MCRRLDGVLPIFQSESRYNGLYRDIGRRGVQQGATIRTATLRHGPTTWPARATTRSACTQGRAAHAHAWLGHGVSRDTRFVSWLGATIWCPDMAQQGCDTTQQRPVTRTAASPTRRTAGACVAIQTLYRDRRACNTTACARDTANARYDMVGHGHDTAPVYATTRPNACSDTAL